MQSAVQATQAHPLPAQGFELWYQPAFESSSGRVQHNEVLLRWRDSQGRLYLPKDFMPLVSRAHMKARLDRLVIQRALKQANNTPEAQLSVNLSQETLHSDSFAEFVCTQLRHFQVLPSALKFEISELQAARDFNRAVGFVKELKEIGCSVVLDNFSNSHLTFMQWEKLGVDVVKINGQFMSNNLGEQDRFLLAKAITDASLQMGQEAVAKSIDEIMEPRLVDECEFGFAQGYQLKPPSRTLSLTSKVDILGMTLDNWTQAEFIAQLDSGVVFTPNVDHVMMMRKDAEYRKAYSIADYKLCNSQVLLMASRLMGEPIKEKIRSADLFAAFCNHHRDNEQTRLFVVGEGYIPAVAAEKINQRAQRELVVDHYAPPANFGPNEIECERMIRHINQSGANTLVLGLSSPTQEKWVYRYQSRLTHIKIIFALGEGLALEAGIEPKVPEAVSRYGAEWLYRLAHDPQHLWKRYLMDDAPFLWLLAKQKMFS
ncbi:MAG: EAL domain-containing protein [Cyanobacteria bacterium P01_F01_bin.3]